MRRRIHVIRAHVKRAYLIGTDYAILGFAIIGLLAIYAQGIQTRERFGHVWFWLFYSVFLLTALRWTTRELKPLARRKALYDRRLKRELDGPESSTTSE